MKWLHAVVTFIPLTAKASKKYVVRMYCVCVCVCVWVWVGGWVDFAVLWNFYSTIEIITCTHIHWQYPDVRVTLLIIIC